jgi:hypothetical protein
MLEGRIDGREVGFLIDGLSTDRQAVFFAAYLRDVLAAKQVIVGAYEYLGTQVVMRFDMPDPSRSWRNAGRIGC